MFELHLIHIHTGHPHPLVTFHHNTIIRLVEEIGRAVDIIHLHARSSVRHRVTVHLARMGDKHHQAIMLHRKFRNHIQEIGKILRLRLSRLRSVVKPVERVVHQNTAPPPHHQLVRLRKHPLRRGVPLQRDMRHVIGKKLLRPHQQPFRNAAPLLETVSGQLLHQLSDVIDNANIRPGDVIVGLASYGQATYEKEYNGGMGSNGLTSARHDVFGKYLAEKYPESYDAAVPEELVYSGNLKLTDSVEGSPIDAGKLVLSPTRTYAPVVKKLLDALRPEIHGMVHCSGGAQTKVLHFVENVRVVKDNLFPVPPLFKTIQEQSGTDWAEMYKVFNMGHRLEVYLSPEHAEEVIAISESFGIPAQIVGRIEACDKTELIIKSEFGEFRY